jgi:hypothetical protein
MLGRSRPCPRPLLAALIAVSLPLGGLPTPAAAAPLYAVMAGDGLTPSEAASARKSVQERAKGMEGASAGELLAEEAAKNGDPVLYIDAAEAYTAGGVKSRSRADLELGIEKARVGLDILYFLQDPRADPDWQPVESDRISKEIGRGKQAIADAEKGIEELARPVEEPKAEPEEKTRKKAPRDGRGLIAAGSLLTVVGVGGLGMMAAGLGLGAGTQSDVDKLGEDLQAGVIDKPTYDMQLADLDDKGKTMNTLAIAGGVVGGVGLAAGVALLVVGVKKRKKYRATHGGGDETARLQVLPMAGRERVGLVLSGRF